MRYAGWCFQESYPLEANHGTTPTSPPSVPSSPNSAKYSPKSNAPSPILTRLEKSKSPESRFKLSELRSDDAPNVKLCDPADNEGTESVFWIPSPAFNSDFTVVGRAALGFGVVLEVEPEGGEGVKPCVEGTEFSPPGKMEMTAVLGEGCKDLGVAVSRCTSWISDVLNLR